MGGRRKYDTSGKQTVKSCGKAHAWCRVCRPDTAEGQRKPKPPNPDLPACRNCGRCDYCLGVAAPDGMKMCRLCGHTKPLAEFPQRADTGGYRNQCKQCRSGGGMEPTQCEGCGKRFWRYGGGEHPRTFCMKCLPPSRTALSCARCGADFVRSMSLRRYCSAECRDAAAKERVHQAALDLRQELIEAYGGRCTCPRCPETSQAFLTLEHINGTGKAHRDVVGSHAYADLRKRGWPQDGYTLLCWNCNLASRLTGVCPHMELALAVAG
jgi:hypothetical protein